MKLIELLVPGVIPALAVVVTAWITHRKLEQVCAGRLDRALEEIRELKRMAASPTSNARTD